MDDENKKLIAVGNDWEVSDASDHCFRCPQCDSLNIDQDMRQYEFTGAEFGSNIETGR